MLETKITEELIKECNGGDNCRLCHCTEYECISYLLELSIEVEKRLVDIGY